MCKVAYRSYFYFCLISQGERIMNEELEELTRRLLDIIEIGREQFEKSKITGIQGDFFLEVKPFADIVKGILDKWIDIVTKWILLEKPLFINEKQIQTTYEHIENISIQSYYPKTSRKLFISSYQSAQFVLQSILHHMEKTSK